VHFNSKRKCCQHDCREQLVIICDYYELLELLSDDSTTIDAWNEEEQEEERKNKKNKTGSMNRQMLF